MIPFQTVLWGFTSHAKSDAILWLTYLNDYMQQVPISIGTWLLKLTMYGDKKNIFSQSICFEGS